MGLNIQTGTYVPPKSETIMIINGNKYDRQTYTRTWHEGESQRFESENNEEGTVRICCVEHRKPKEESTSSTKATWFIQPLNWMEVGTFKVDQQPLGVVNINTIARQFTVLDIVEMDGWENKAKSDLSTCAKWSMAEDVKWETDMSTGKYRACVSLKWIEKVDGDAVRHDPIRHCWNVYSEWTVGNSLEIVQPSIMRSITADLKTFYAGMQIVSKA